MARSEPVLVGVYLKYHHRHLQEAEVARARAGLYRVVAHMAAHEPDEAFLRALNTPPFRLALVNLGLSPPPVPLPREAESVCEALAVEYARLFLLPGTLLHPYESVQRGEGQLWGDLTVKVQQAYHDAGFTLASEVHQVPDHLALELEFMAHLASQEAWRWTAGAREDVEALKKRQKAFMRDHLGTWAVTFAHTLRAETNQQYFRFLADLLEIVTDSELFFLNTQS
jgi:TorA maturation chaperone TorD